MDILSLQLMVLFLALIADLLLGDPDWLWRRIIHPVAFMGQSIGFLERKLLKTGDSSFLQFLKGVVLVSVLVLICVGLGLTVTLASRASFLWLIGDFIVITILLAQKSLIEHVEAVLRKLEQDDMGAARQQLGKIVGRQTSHLGRSAIIRATVESCAENCSDGVVAPWFYYLVFGLPGLIGYKLINTADSMIGHRSSRYLYFGKFAAKLDDVMNYIPARLCALLYFVAAAICSLDHVNAIRCAFKDAAKHASPNAGWPESAVAGALHIALGGPRTYHNSQHHFAWLNEAGTHEPDIFQIRKCITLTRVVYLLVLLVTFVFWSFSLV